jgi:hypothetical protein
MAYREPRLQIFQDFIPALAAGAEPLFATIIGPQYDLHRFGDEDEEAKITDYDPVIATADFAWPDKAAGSEVDLATAEIIAKDALLRYYIDPLSVNVTVDDGNKVRDAAKIFKTNDFASNSAVFGTRGVLTGDVAIIRYIDPSDSLEKTVRTEVIDFEADVVPGTTDPVIARVSGFGDTVAGSSESTTPPTRFTTAYDVASYDGLADGFPSDTYTIQVIAKGTSGVGLLDGTVLRITSAGGDNNATDLELGVDVIFAAGDYDVPLGARGAVLGLTDAGAGSFDVGDSWQVVISMTYTEVDVTSPAEFDATGPYTGAKNTQYRLTVLQGGEIDTDTVIVGFTTNNGADVDGQVSVAAAGAVAIGNNGMTLTFITTTQFNTGDVIVFDVAAESDGAIRTLVLRDPIPITTATDLDLELHEVKTIDFPTAFYTLTADTITILGSATHSEDLLGKGTVETFPILEACLFADYRELRVDLANQLFSTTSVTAALELAGTAVTENPLGRAVNLALQNSGGIQVFWIPVESDDVDGYAEALDVATENEVVYSMVPLSNDQDVRALFRTYVLERSNPDNNQWRIAWFGNDTGNVIPVLTEDSGGDDVEATVTELGTGLYRQVNSSNGFFETNGVEGGDTLRINFSLDAEGVEIYDEFLIDRVEDESTLVLAEPLDAEITVAVKIEVHRSLSKGEYATELGQFPALFDTRRVYSVFADGVVEEDGTPDELFYMAAGLAGQRSGVPPHAPLSQVELIGYFMEPTQNFSRQQLNTIASGGNWVVVKDIQDGRIFTRHQVSTETNPDNLIEREQSITTNVDHISRDFFLNTQDLFGQANVSPEMLQLIRQRVNSLIEKISNRPYDARLGPQLQGAEIVTLQIDELLRDTVLVEIEPVLPIPLNNLIIRFRVS